MSPEEACSILSAHSTVDSGRFYGPATGLQAGTGLIFEGVRCPHYEAEDRVYATVENCVYVLTHECDISQENTRVFNDFFVVCPVMTIESVVGEYLDFCRDISTLTSFLAQVAQRRVSRMIYLPPAGPGPLELGGFIYLNNLVSTGIQEISGREGIVALSGYGLQIVDQVLMNHLLRPKSQALPLTVQ